MSVKLSFGSKLELLQRFCNVAMLVTLYHLTFDVVSAERCDRLSSSSSSLLRSALKRSTYHAKQLKTCCRQLIGRHVLLMWLTFGDDIQGLDHAGLLLQRDRGVGKDYGNRPHIQWSQSPDSGVIAELHGNPALY